MLKKDLQNPDFISLAAYTYYKQFTGNEMEVKLIAIYAKCQDLLNSALIIYYLWNIFASSAFVQKMHYSLLLLHSKCVFCCTKKKKILKYGQAARTCSKGHPFLGQTGRSTDGQTDRQTHSKCMQIWVSSSAASLIQ